MKRVFLIVLIDSFGIGEMPDAAEFGDEGGNTLLSCSGSAKFHLPNMKKLETYKYRRCPARRKGSRSPGLTEGLPRLSRGKDTTVGHWELMGTVSKSPFLIYEGFPKEVLDEFTEKTGRGVLCNRNIPEQRSSHAL